MISDHELLHGAALLKLIEHVPQVSIRHHAMIHPSLYVLERGEIIRAVLLKFSTRRKSPWQFTFSQQEESAIVAFKNSNLDISLHFGLVCHKDGVCCVDYSDLMNLMPDGTVASRRIGVARQPSGSYHLSGPDRQRFSRTVR